MQNLSSFDKKRISKISIDVLVSLLLTLNIQHFTPFSSVSIVDFEQVNVNWVIADFEHAFVLNLFNGKNKNIRTTSNNVVLMSLLLNLSTFNAPADNCLFKVNNESTRTMREICSKLTIKTPLMSSWYLYC